MAQILPSQPSGSLSVGTLRVFQALKRLSDDWTIWLNLTGDVTTVPDFLACHRKTNRCFFLSVIAGPKAGIGQSQIDQAVERIRSFLGQFSFADDLGLVVCHHDLVQLPDFHATSVIEAT